MVVFDTNILIEIYRGNVSIKNQIYHINAQVYYISNITIAEFIAGARDKNEYQQIQKQLSYYTVLPINTDISNIFIDLFGKFALSHRPAIPDVLIAATALYYKLPLYTLNVRDFQYIPDLVLL